jgi:hypothetical protein
LFYPDAALRLPVNAQHAGRQAMRFRSRVNFVASLEETV